MATTMHDVVVIGAGPVAENVADRAVEAAGLRIWVVDYDLGAVAGSALQADGG